MTSFHPRILLVLTFICCSQLVIAQNIAQGTWMAGGEAGFQSSKPKGGESSTTFTLSPDIGYYIIDDLAIGFAGTYSHTSLSSNSITTLSLNPWVRYYVYKNLFGRLSYEVGKYSLGFNGDEAETTFDGFDISAGFSTWLTNSIALEPVLFYRAFSSKDESENIRETSFGLRVGIQAFLGRD